MMPAGDLIFDDYQFEYNGILLGSDSGFAVVDVSGLGGYGTVGSGTVERFGRHGSVPGQQYLGKREFIIQFDVLVPDYDDVTFAEKLDMVYYAFSIRSNPLDEIPLVFQLPGRSDKVFINCRPIEMQLPYDRTFSLKLPRCSIRMEASYPFIRGLDQKSILATYVSDATGLDFPLDFPLNFGASSGANQNSLNNDGTAPAHWTAIISGSDVVNPSITESVSGRTIMFDTLTLGPGETMVLDSERRSVMLNGTASRRHLLHKDSRWFQIPPKEQSGIIFLTENVATDARCEVIWHDTFWSI